MFLVPDVNQGFVLKEDFLGVIISNVSSKRDSDQQSYNYNLEMVTAKI